LIEGAGWVAIALVSFSFLRPTLCLAGAYFFGAFTALPFALQSHGVTLAPVLVSSRAARPRFGASGALGLPTCAKSASSL
jgi:hypothetical protein